MSLLTMVSSDIAYAVRQILRRPSAPIVIVLSLGVAQGINTSLFSFANAAWFRGWDVDEPGAIRIVSPAVPVAKWQYWTAHVKSLSGIAAFHFGPMVRIDGNRRGLAFVSDNYFPLLRVRMQLGRLSSTEDDAVVVSDRYWRMHLGADPNVVGRSIAVDPDAATLKRVTFRIAAVAAPGFEGPDQRRVALWAPLGASRFFEEPKPSAQPDSRSVTAFARLARNAASQSAQAELAVLGARFDAERGTTARAPIQLHTTDRFSEGAPSLQAQATLASLLAGVVFITLIACANVSNLVLARGLARHAELATRRALGATRGQVVRLLLLESVALVIVAAWVAAMIALWLPGAMMRAFFANTSPDFGELLRVTFPLDWRVLLWLIATSAVACGAFGLFPALRSADAELGGALKDARTASWSLLSYQTIVSVMALAIAGLILRSDPARDARARWRAMGDLSVVRLDVRRAGGVPQTEDAIETVAGRLRAMAGAGNVAGMAAPAQPGGAQTLQVTPDYFHLLGIAWTAGRAFGPADRREDVMVVNETFVRMFWPDGVALNRTLARGTAGLWDRRLAGRRVVGVVADTQLSSPAAYLLVAPGDVRILFARAPLQRVAGELHGPVVAALAPGVNAEVLAGRDWLATIAGPTLLGAYAAMGFGVIALALGTVGFFSVLEYAVRQRTREIGIRIALGARSRHVVQSLLAPASIAMLRGLAFGAAGAIYVGFVMRRAEIPSGVHPLDGPTLVVVAAVLVAAAFAAAFRPARRAMRIEPSEALRVD